MREAENVFAVMVCGVCRFRFPVWLARPQPHLCPLCHMAALQIISPYPAHEVQTTPPVSETAPLIVLLDNIRSTHNVGSIFRTADGVGIQHLHLCGITPTPAHPKLAKTALGAEGWVGWTYHKNGLDAAAQLQSQGYQLWAIEGGGRAQPLYQAQLPVHQPIALVIGNELAGIDPDILNLCDKVWSIPMQGHKRSLNVAVAFGIAAYSLRMERRRDAATLKPETQN